MNSQSDPESKPPIADLDQWRRDIEIFAAATTSALDAIVNELSNACSGDQNLAASLNRQATTVAPIAKHSNNALAVKQAAASIYPINQRTAPSDGNSRLASLKEKLASRIRKG